MKLCNFRVPVCELSSGLRTLPATSADVSINSYRGHDIDQYLRLAGKRNIDYLAENANGLL